jgi:adenine deaminase
MCRRLRTVRAVVQALGCPLTCAYGALSLLALLVIPELRITARGPFDVVRQKFVRP